MLTTLNSVKMADKLVKKGDVVTVVGTGTSKFLPYGKETKVHRVQADKLIEAGKATLKKGK